MKNYRVESAAVLYSAEQTPRVCLQDARMLMRALEENRALRSMRLCTHIDAAAPLHQMFIVLRRGAYIRPHRHRAREMMITLFAGEMSVMIFSDDGAVEDVVPMGDFASGKSFYCRIPEGKYYTQIIESGQAFFGEVLLGPFQSTNVLYADFAPEADSGSAAAYLAMMTEKSRQWRAGGA